MGKDNRGPKIIFALTALYELTALSVTNIHMNTGLF